MNQNAFLLVAQITDTHLFADPNQEWKGTLTAKTLRSVLELIEQQQPQPDLLLLTGDLSQDETAESYQQLQTLLNPLSIPCYWIPGNHDRLPLMEQILTEKPFFPDKSFQVGGWQFILLNTAIPGCVHGELSPHSLQWLEHQLQQASNCPTLISLHHPPVPANTSWMEDIGLHHPEELLDIIDRNPQVRLVVFGHIHQEFTSDRQGVRYVGTPSTCIQFTPNSPKLVLDSLLPGFRLFELYPDGRWETKVKRVKGEKAK